MQKQHDLVIIGGGAAGLTAAEVAAVLSIDVAMIEGNKIGGDCTWYGCIPSKALLTAAKNAHIARNSATMGIHTQNVCVDFEQVMNWVRGTSQTISEREDATHLREKGITVYEAYAKFVDPHTLELSTGEMIRAKKIIIATGAKTRVLAGFSDVPYLTHLNLFELTEQPEHLIIIGGGPIGTEMAQAFCRLGSQVTLITDMERLLPHDEPEASELIAQILSKEGVRLICGKKAVSAKGTEGNITVVLDDDTTINGSHVLLAVGKYVDIRNLNPDAAGIAHEDGRLILDESLCTSQSHIYAAGDITGAPMFSHASTSEATIAVINAISPIRSKRKKNIPWTTFTDPEIAHAGLTEAEVKNKGIEYDITCSPMTSADRAMTDGKTEGFIKLIHSPWGKLYGATIVGQHAGEMMNEWSAIIERKGNVSQAATPIHIYPTFGIANALIASEQLRKIADQTWIGKLSKRIARWLI